MKKLLSTTDRVKLELIKTRLDDAAVEYLVKNEFPPAAGEIVPAVAWPEIWVLDENDWERAHAVLQEADAVVAAEITWP